MSFDTFVEITRNDLIESRHFGAAAICNHRGELLHSWGDVDQFIFPRSAIKPLLAIPMIELEASDHYKLKANEIALSCASHQGEKFHTEVLSRWLQRLGLEEQHLACGCAWPEDELRARELVANGQSDSRLHHNCSGKHLGFLTTAMHIKAPLNNYCDLEHPVQQLGLQAVSELVDFDLSNSNIGVDGCGFPAPSMPLVALAHGAAKFADPCGLSAKRSAAIGTIQQALAKEPLFMAGSTTLVSDLNRVTKGAVIAKTGAEGVIIAWLPQRGLGIALKIADGSDRARTVALMAILLHLKVLSNEQQVALQHYIAPSLMNSQGVQVGEIRAAKGWL